MEAASPESKGQKRRHQQYAANGFSTYRNSVVHRQTKVSAEVQKELEFQRTCKELSATTIACLLWQTYLEFHSLRSTIDPIVLGLAIEII